MIDTIKRWLERVLEFISISLLITMAVIVVLAVVFRFLGQSLIWYDEVASVVDVLQTPAFLVRQTNFIRRVAQAGKPVNVKKGQFLAPWDMSNVIEKARSTGNQQMMITERGAMFGYNNLVVDFRGLALMRAAGYPVIFDATHSVQLPGGDGTSSGGQREYAPVLARAAVAAGVDGIFLEVHTDPDRALCDGPNSLKLDNLDVLLSQLKAIRNALPNEQ